jgi:hypothetical protein
MTAKLTDRERWRRELSSAAPAIAIDALTDLVFSELLSREAELVACQLRLRPMRDFLGKKSRSWTLFARCFD